MTLFRHIPRLRICIAFFVVAMAAACSSSPTLHSFFDNEADDSCRDQRAALQSYGDYFANNMLIGGAIGAATGGLLGVATHQSVHTTLTEAFAGFAIGAAAGYWESVQQKDATMVARQRQVQTDVKAENAKVDGAQQAFNRLVSCRRRQAATLRADVAAGRVARADGAKTMATIKARFDDDIEIARKIDANIATHSANLEYANEQIKPQPYVTIRASTVFADKSTGSAKVTTLNAEAIVSGAAVDDKWVKVTLSGKQTGYVQATDVVLQAAHLAENKKTRATPPASATGNPVSEGVFTNLSKQADFNDSVQTASANTSGFELSGG
jgi:hypothetical protein